MRDIYRVDTGVLRTNNENINEEKNNFINYTYKTFLDGYICNSSDSKILQMKNRLTIIYNDIENAYNKITKWFDNYISDVDNLEVSLQERTNKLNPNGVYSQRILSAISASINYNKNEIDIAPSIYDDMNKYIEGKKSELDAELNKIDDREAYVSKYGEEEGNKRYYEAIEQIKKKQEEYDLILYDLSEAGRYGQYADDPNYIILQNEIDAATELRNKLAEELQAEMAEKSIEELSNDEEFLQKKALFDELGYYISELKHQQELFPYYSLMNRIFHC